MLDSHRVKNIFAAHSIKKVRHFYEPLNIFFEMRYVRRRGSDDQDASPRSFPAAMHPRMTSTSADPPEKTIMTLVTAATLASIFGRGKSTSWF